MFYDHKEIEAKWQKYWADRQTFKAEWPSEKPKFYALTMFPYPSGAGLHVGHPLGYIACDIYARFKRHQGFNVLQPMGYDSFGLPAEQYAIQTGQHPALTTEVNINRYREQLDALGFSYDWSREVRTSRPAYYKWTQWIFMQLFDSWYNRETDRAEPISTLVARFEAGGNQGLDAACDADTPIFTATQWNAYTAAERQRMLLRYRLTYLAEAEVNWCPELGTVLANDEVVNGVSERGGFPVVRKKMTQWSMRITAYAQRLLDGLDRIDWPQPLKDAQTNWIGRSVGASVVFKTQPTAHQPDTFDIEVFTTRPDTIFGVSFMTLAPEHELVEKITTPEQARAVQDYVAASARRSERERMADVKTVSGVFTGAYAAHPLTGEPVPVWIGDYVLAGYGTGAVMAVPCGDQRDFDFARHFGIPIPNIFEGVSVEEEAYEDKQNAVIANSGFISGLGQKEAARQVIAALEEKGLGRGTINYRLRDAVFSRQRYWGEPFPVYYDAEGLPHLLPEHCLPLELPEVEKYLPTETGEPPLGNATRWAWDAQAEAVTDNARIDHKTVFPLELNTMPGWAGSSQYFNRYMDPRNDQALVSPEAIGYWKDVDVYIGGSEHATGHLLYSRFWQKFMFDRGWVPVDEYAQKLINQGMILGTSAFIHRRSGTQTYLSSGLAKGEQTEPIRVDANLVNASNELDTEALRSWQPQYAEAEFLSENGVFKVDREVEKMSKSKYNVVNPDQICEEYGADALRLYEMFLGPLEQSKPWNTAGLSGVYSFLKKLWRLYHQGPDRSFEVLDGEPSAESLKTLHKTIKKVTEDIQEFSFNTSVSSFMICVNELTAQNCRERAVLEPLAVLIEPYAPHMAEELWQKLGHQDSIARAPYPAFNPDFLVESTKEYPISFNGKLRFTMELPLDLSKDELEARVMADARTQEQLQGRTPKKVIVVPGRIVNIVG
ncbi:leucine--tRNA ligase [Robiginitalea sp. M366]|uniref:leucine--tRNA ligase n=1 Tax=Robiginitalea aestuariiviva TaxID=3036903 RepID=UPI00240E3457|nr:leucine--tRNA ligase [Robiginitalea aestuariiviva]MDG1571754.1 leucine--tRNA ligase [Robiginitalea aestuariiviva]